MALTLEQLTDLIKDRGRSRDSDLIDNALAAFDRSVLRGFGRDFGDIPLSIVVDTNRRATFREFFDAVVSNIKSQRAEFAEQAALDQALANLEKELG